MLDLRTLTGQELEEKISEIMILSYAEREALQENLSLTEKQVLDLVMRRARCIDLEILMKHPHFNKDCVEYVLSFGSKMFLPEAVKQLIWHLPLNHSVVALYRDKKEIGDAWLCHPRWKIAASKS